MMAIFQIWVDFPVEKLRLKMSSSSCLALGPRALRNIGDIIWPWGAFGAHLEDGLIELLLSQGSAAAFSCSRGFQRGFQLSDAVPFLLTAAFSFMKALALPRLVVKVRPLCSRGSANVVEEGVPDSDLIVLHVRAGSGLFSRSARNSFHFIWRASSECLRVAAQASRYSVRLSAIVRRRAFRFLMTSRSSGVDQGLVYRPALDFHTWSFASAIRIELKRWTLSPSDKGV